jgi:hypothetical protein
VAFWSPTGVQDWVPAYSPASAGFGGLLALFVSSEFSGALYSWKTRRIAGATMAVSVPLPATGHTSTSYTAKWPECTARASSIKEGQRL